MIFILLALLLALDILFFILFDRNILSPTVLAVSMFALSTAVAVMNIDNWKFTISAYTAVMIVSSLMFMGVGEMLVRLSFHRRRQSSGNQAQSEPIEVGTAFIIAFSVIMGILCVHYMQELMRLAVSAGYKKGEGLLFVAYVRTAMLRPEIYGRTDRIAGWSSTFAGIFAYIFLYIVCYNMVFFKKFNILHLVPVVTYLPYKVFSGGRAEFIYMIAFLIVVGGTFYLQKNRWRLRYVLRVLGFGAIGIAAFLAVFILVGSLKSSSITSNIFSTISFYTGMSIPSLDDYFLNPRPRGEYFGEHVLFGIYSFLREFDSSIPEFYAPYDFVSFNGTKGNVYTMIRRYHQDFGVFGLYGMMLFLGFFYGGFYLMVNKKSGFGLLLYGFIIAPVVEASIEERFFMIIVSHSKLAICIILYVFFIFFCSNSFRRSLGIVFRCSIDKFPKERIKSKKNTKNLEK